MERIPHTPPPGQDNSENQGLMDAFVQLPPAFPPPPAEPPEQLLPPATFEPSLEEKRTVARMCTSLVLFVSQDRFLERVRERFPNFPSSVARELYDAGCPPASRPTAEACRIPITPPEPVYEKCWPQIDRDNPIWDDEESMEPSVDDEADPDHVPSVESVSDVLQLDNAARNSS